MKKARTVFIGFVSTLAVSASHAAFIVDTSQVGPASGVVSTVATNNDIAPLLLANGLNATEYFIGGRLGTDTGGRVTFEYVGNEAGYVNRFFADGGELFSTANRQDSIFDSVTSDYISLTDGGGLLDFAFCTDGERRTGVNAGCITNSANSFWLPSGGEAPKSIAISLLDPFTALLWWDDSGAGPDDNHDDMVVIARLSVPEPATSLLLGLGLLGIAAASRKRSSVQV
jgi:hypothetical protein